MTRKSLDPEPGTLSSEAEREAFESFYYGWYLQRIPQLMLAFGGIICILSLSYLLFGVGAQGLGGNYIALIAGLFGLVLVVSFFYLRLLLKDFEARGKRTLADFFASGLMLFFSVIVGTAPEIPARSVLFLLGLASLLMVPRMRPMAVLLAGGAATACFVAIDLAMGTEAAAAAFSGAECAAGVALAFIVSLACYRDRAASFDYGYRMNLANKALRSVSDVDQLTGLANAKKSDLLFFREWERARRQKESVAVAVLDIDSFKAFNERFGKHIGDEFLLLLTTALKKCAKRKTDLVVRGIGQAALRYGGDEFLVLLPRTDDEGAMKVARAVMDEINGITLLDGKGGSVPSPTVSMGLAAAVPGPETEIKDLLLTAEVALRNAKDSGGGVCKKA
ncbi:MAG TPA: GGDEF domain-containing protein [Bacillota bacterium]|nr:GGDEF domain-containing protein [Bacillota bacterium]